MFRRHFSCTKTLRNANHQYSQTLSLPVTSFPSRSSAASNDAYLNTSTDQLYQHQSSVSSDKFKHDHLFVLHDGPPYANGDLHLGHSINKVLKDIVNRSKLLNNQYQIKYIPGFDCHGLPIELKALHSIKKDDLTTKLSAVEVRKAAKNHALQTIKSQTKAFKLFGVMGEWETPYRTLDKQYEINQLNLFKDMYANGLIKRQKRPVYWGCETGTALAEGELEYNDKHKSTAAFIKFPIVGSLAGHEKLQNKPISFLIWTSTPWTIAANKAICINQDFDYTLLETAHEYLVVQTDLAKKLVSEDAKLTAVAISGKDLLQLSYTNPIVKDTRFPVLHGNHVTKVTGTGLVHTAPGHGHEDYIIGLENGLEIYSPVDNKGRYTSDLLQGYQRLEGLKVLHDGTKNMLKLLKEHNMIFSINYNLIHSYPYDWRSKKPIVIRSTPQWFTDLSTVKARALESLDDVKFHPEKGRNRLSSFIKNRNEWCISRQRYWGVPIPVFYHKETGEPLISEAIIELIINKISEIGSDAWFEPEDSIERWLPETHNVNPHEYKKGTDTVDVWFDSGSSWTVIRDLMATRGITDRKFLADVYLEGSDQHRGWFQSSLLTKIAAGDKHAPFATVITHGFTLDGKGMKMSKSVGNTVDPQDVIQGKRGVPKLGVDGLRLWIASAEYTSDLTMSNVVLKHVADNLKKIRVTFRFLLGNLGDYTYKPAELSILDKYILTKLNILVSTCDRHYQNFQYNRIIQDLNYFTNVELSATYFNVIKDKLYADNSNCDAIKYVLGQILLGQLYILSPILPVITQEVWEHTPASLKSDAKCPLIHDYSFEAANDEKVVELFEKQIWVLRDEVLKIIEIARKDDKSIKNSLEADLIIQSDSQFARFVQDTFPDIQELADILLVSHVRLVESATIDSCERQKEITIDGKPVKIAVVNSEEHKCPRCWKYTAPVQDELCLRCVDVLK